MNLLEITINAGPTAGERVRVLHSPATFGRDAENALVVALPTVSRVHGEFRFEDDRWTVVNRSPNGTTVNHRSIGRRAKVLADGDQIVIGNQPVMTVTLRNDEDATVVSTETSGDIGPAYAEAKRAGISARTKLWLTLAGFWAVVFTLAFVFAGLESGEGSRQLPAIPMLSNQTIAQAVREPLPKQEPSPRTAAYYFEEAERFYQLIQADPRNVFRAYHSYKTALSYTFGGDFTDERDDWGGKTQAERGLAQKRMLELENNLVESLTRLYADAWGKLRDQRYGEAQRAFKRVMDLYQDPQSRIFKNAEKQRDLARRQQDARA